VCNEKTIESGGSEKDEKISGSKSNPDSPPGLSNLANLANMLADKFAMAVEQLGSGGEEIDTNRLRQLVGVMKDLTGIAENAEDDGSPEEKQSELVDIIRLAIKECRKNPETPEKKEETDFAS